MTRTPELILASGSPRRRVLLDQIGLRYRIRIPEVDESTVLNQNSKADPSEIIQCVAALKARQVAFEEQKALILSADTGVVAPDGEILGQPRDATDAQTMLKRLAGRTHYVVTGMVLYDVARAAQAGRSVSTWVTMKPYDERRINWYVASGEPFGKAGAYAIQGRGALFVETISGSYSNVVGLALEELEDLFSRLGYSLFTYVL